MKLCPKCNVEHDKNGAFCSRKCANSRVWNDHDKIKKSNANKGTPSWSKGKILGPDALDSTRRASARENANKNSLLKFESGNMTERSALRKHLQRLFGNRCSSCSIENWNGKPITLQVDHIDGNAGNNLPENLRLMCPNCHSQTENFGARNKGNGRRARGLPLR